MRLILRLSKMPVKNWQGPKPLLIRLNRKSDRRIRHKTGSTILFGKAVAPQIAFGVS